MGSIFSASADTTNGSCVKKPLQRSEKNAICRMKPTKNSCEYILSPCEWKSARLATINTGNTENVVSSKMTHIKSSYDNKLDYTQYFESRNDDRNTNLVYCDLADGLCDLKTQ